MSGERRHRAAREGVSSGALFTAKVGAPFSRKRLFVGSSKRVRPTCNFFFTRRYRLNIAPGRAVPRATLVAALAMIQHGTIHALPELCRNASSLHDHSVRVTGALESYDPVAARARVGVDGESLWVDVSKVSGADPHRVGSLYQYIGARRRRRRGRTRPHRTQTRPPRARRALRRRPRPPRLSQSPRDAQQISPSTQQAAALTRRRWHPPSPLDATLDAPGSTRLPTPAGPQPHPDRSFVGIVGNARPGGDDACV